MASWACGQKGAHLASCVASKLQAPRGASLTGCLPGRVPGLHGAYPAGCLACRILLVAGPVPLDPSHSHHLHVGLLNAVHLPRVLR